MILIFFYRNKTTECSNKSTLHNKKLIFLLQEMLIIIGLTRNHTVCFVSWLFDGVIRRVVLCCVVSITQKSFSLRWVYEHHLMTFYSTQFLCSNQCLLDCTTVQFYRFLRKMLPLFSGLKILSFSSSLSHFAATYFVLSITMPLKLQTLLHKSLIFFNEKKNVDVILSFSQCFARNSSHLYS